MTKFTTTPPAADAFGADARYIVIHPERGEIHSPCSSRQITVERFGFAARGGYQWALVEPDMAKLLLAGQPAQGATGDSNLEALWKVMDRIADHAASAEGDIKIIQQHIELAKTKAPNAP